MITSSPIPIFATIFNLTHTLRRLLHSFPTRRSSDSKIRDLIQTIRQITQQQSVESNSHNVDAIGSAYLHGVACLYVLFIRNGKRSEEHTSELQSRFDIVCRLRHEKRNIK